VLVHYFRFTNTTGQTLTLGQPRGSCWCVSASILKSQVAPGETSAVVAYMDTRRIPTPNTLKSVIVYVPFHSPYLEEVALRVQTVSRDDLMMSPDTLAFGTVRKGQGGKVSTKVTLMTDPNWQVTAAVSTGGYVKAEAKLESRQGSMVTYEVTATLNPGCPAGNWTSDVYLTTSNAGVAKLRIPVTVNVVAALAARPDAVQLGNVKLGKAAEQRVIVQASQPFKVVKVNGTDDQVVVTLDSEEARPIHVLTLSVNPKLVGGFNRTVEIMTDSKEQPMLAVPVTAKVVGP